MIKRVFLLLDLILFFQMVLHEKMNSAQTIMWTLILLLLPGVGTVLYLLIGSSLPTRWGHSRKAHAPVLSITGDNDAFLFEGWEKTKPQMLSDIEQAKQTIFMSFYGFADDEEGHQWLTALCDAAQRGVKVYVLFDAFGSLQTSIHYFQPLIEKGGEVHKIRPWPTQYRYHRKMLIVDGLVAWTGSMNIGNKYINRHPIKTPWRDTQVRILGSAAREMEKLFLYDWRCFGNSHILAENAEPLPHTGNTKISILYSGAGAHANEIKNAWLDLINGAQKSLLLQSPYLVPDDAVLSALQSAARRGVKVIIMLPGISSGPHIQPFTDENAILLMNCGAKILLYPGYLHAKTLCQDEAITCIGSVNLDVRSMKLDEENSAMIQDAAFSHQFVKQFQANAETCTLFDPAKAEKKTAGTRAIRFLYALV